MDGESPEGAPSDGTAEGAIRGHFVLELADVRRGLSEGSRAIKFRLVGFVVAWIVLLQVARTLNGGVETHMWWGPLLVAGIAIPALLYGFLRAASKVMENRTAQERDITWEFDDAGYHIKTPGSESRAGWETVHRTVEGKTTFLLYPAAHVYQIIPKRAFREADLPRIRELFRTRVTPRPSKSRRGRMLALWIVLVVSFLAVWQFLDQPRQPPHDPDRHGE